MLKMEEWRMKIKQNHESNGENDKIRSIIIIKKKEK